MIWESWRFNYEVWDYTVITDDDDVKPTSHHMSKFDNMLSEAKLGKQIGEMSSLHTITILEVYIQVPGFD